MSVRSSCLSSAHVCYSPYLDLSPGNQSPEGLVSPLCFGVLPVKAWQDLRGDIQGHYSISRSSRKGQGMNVILIKETSSPHTHHARTPLRRQEDGVPHLCQAWVPLGAPQPGVAPDASPLSGPFARRGGPSSLFSPGRSQVSSTHTNRSWSACTGSADWEPYIGWTEEGGAKSQRAPRVRGAEGSGGGGGDGEWGWG